MRVALLPAVALVVGLATSPLVGANSPFIPGVARTANSTPQISGAVLLTELGCVACHSSGNAALAPKPGPDLSAVGARVAGGHLRKFIAAPSATKPGTTMPDVLGHLPATERTATADALAHYLASLGSKPIAFEKPALEAVERGRKLYHSIGCVACHSPEAPLADSVPLGPLEEKYSVASLAKFLEDPLAVRPGGRMPDFKLEPIEARDLASYLLRNQASPVASVPPDAPLAMRGKALFAQHRCDACHSVGGPRTTPAVLPALNRLNPARGCLSTERGVWPQYSLTDSQRTAIRAALAAQAEPLSAAQNVELTLTRLNCLACHQRGDLGGVPANRLAHFTGKDENLGDQGRLPPPLTGVGAKLRRGALRDVVAGGDSVRPYLNTRMPKFGAANAELLVAWLKQLDTLPPAKFDRVPESAKPRNVGRDLAGSKGLNCIACHTFREKSSASIRALDLMTMAGRLEENWFHHYMTQPQRFSPLTIMPGFWPDGKSPLPNVLGGDSAQQRDALWQWLAQGPEAGEPSGLVLEPLVVEVKDEAVIIRRAFPGIGKRGLGVGYPGGINLAFDAAQMRLASVWSGGFIEASSLWRGQGAGQARLLGKEIVNFPPGPAFAVLATPAAPWPVLDLTPRPSPDSFLGYSLDAQQRPTLRYAVGGVVVEDFFIERRDGAENLYFERTLKFPAAPPAGLHFRVAADKQIEAMGDNLFAVGKNLRVRLPADAMVREADNGKELLLPARGAFTVEYHLTRMP